MCVTEHTKQDQKSVFWQFYSYRYAHTALKHFCFVVKTTIITQLTVAREMRFERHNHLWLIGFHCVDTLNMTHCLRSFLLLLLLLSNIQYLPLELFKIVYLFRMDFSKNIDKKQISWKIQQSECFERLFGILFIFLLVSVITRAFSKADKNVFFLLQQSICMHYFIEN